MPRFDFELSKSLGKKAGKQSDLVDFEELTKYLDTLELERLSRSEAIVNAFGQNILGAILEIKNPRIAAFPILESLWYCHQSCRKVLWLLHIGP